MNNLITGLHHVTALAADTQANVNFYAGILGLRMVKKTVNFDAPDVYHLYYGDYQGNPGTIMTFFPFQGLRRGKHGNGQMTVTAFSIPAGSVEYWQQRLTRFNIKYNDPAERLDGEVYIYLQDQDGLGIELVVDKLDNRKGNNKGPVPDSFAIKGFHSARLHVENINATADLLTSLLGYELLAGKGNYFRYALPGQKNQCVDLMQNNEYGMSGSGTVHHLAFATENDETQLMIREKIEEAGFNVTPVLDRQYFHSIYFREPGGVLFEVATNPPGFSVDEQVDKLGNELKLPAWIEPRRVAIENKLSPIDIDISKFND